ncbi:hypothetical protein Nmel_001820 [Mimus melanotis]
MTFNQHKSVSKLRCILQLVPPSERISGCSTVCFCLGYMTRTSEGLALQSEQNFS